MPSSLKRNEARVAVVLFAIFVSLSTPLLGQSEALSPDISLELGVGLSRAPHGGGYAKVASLRVLPGRWGGGIRALWLDGGSRGRGAESFRDLSALGIYAVDTSPSTRIHLGAGLGRLTGLEYLESAPEFRDVDRIGLAVEAVAYGALVDFVRLALGVQGHISAGGLAGGFTFGLAVGTRPMGVP